MHRVLEKLLVNPWGNMGKHRCISLYIRMTCWLIEILSSGNGTIPPEIQCCFLSGGPCGATVSFMRALLLGSIAECAGSCSQQFKKKTLRRITLASISHWVLCLTMIFSLCIYIYVHTYMCVCVEWWFMVSICHKPFMDKIYFVYYVLLPQTQKLFRDASKHHVKCLCNQNSLQVVL